MGFKKIMTASSAVAVLVAMTTACGTSSTSNTSNSAGSDSSSAKSVEIFSWWTAGGEADGLKALIKDFQQQNAGVQVINSAVAGGAGSNAHAVLATRMKGGNPPDTFQVHGGQELMSFVDAGEMEPLTDLYQSEGWNNTIPKALIDMDSKDGQPYAVPVDIHRGNVLWYNKQVFDQYHLTAPTTWNDFFKDADVLKAHGVTPLALGDKDTWEATMLWEDVLLGQLGADDYDKLWKGQLGFDDPRVKQSLDTFKKLLTYVNTDHAALAWQDAAQRVSDGKAAMNVMGDWEKGFFTSLNKKPNVDFGWTTTPGTSADFMVINDSFGLPKGAKHVQAVKDFLKVLGSAQGQVDFNVLKGSIPARTDADPSKFDVYSQAAMKDFKSDSLTPSLAHGSAANPGFVNAVNQAMTVFVSSGDENQFISALKSAAQENPLS